MRCGSDLADMIKSAQGLQKAVAGLEKKQTTLARQLDKIEQSQMAGKVRRNMRHAARLAGNEAKTPVTPRAKSPSPVAAKATPPKRPAARRPAVAKASKK